MTMKHLLPIVALTAISFTSMAVAQDNHTATATTAQAASTSAAMPEGHPSMPSFSVPAGAIPDGHPSIPTSAMPEGHPSIEDAAGAPSASATNLPNEGKVVDVRNASGYTYVEVTYKDATRWLAAPRVDVAKDAMIRYGNGSVMKDFFSKSMNKTFPEILFLDRIVVVSSGDNKK
jgi:hypothetical protein